MFPTLELDYCSDASCKRPRSKIPQRNRRANGSDTEGVDHHPGSALFKFVRCRRISPDLPKASELVPGDVVRLRLGDIVPADARLLDGDSIEVDQSALTGESLPVTAKPGGAVYSGSIIRQGEIDAIVYATGTNTYFGKTAQMVQSAHTISHFQKAVLKIGDYLIILAVALVALILAFALFRGDKVLTTLEFCLVLLVAAIPVAMPTVLSVTMAVGARLLAKKEAIVTRLSAIEELAGVDVLCSDKIA